TYADFHKYGIHRHALAPAIREAVALGFLRITRQGRAGNSEFRRSTLYKLTFVNTVDGEPTHDWKRIKSLDEAEMKAREARAAQRQNTKLQCRRPAPRSVPESGTDNGDFLAPEFGTTSDAFSGTTSDISGGERGQSLKAKVR